VALVNALTTETASQLALLRQAPFLAAALAEVECGVTVANPNLEDSPLIYVNDAFTRMTGYTRAETLGRNCRFLQGHLRDQPGIQTIRNALVRGVDCTTVLTNIRKTARLLRTGSDCGTFVPAMAPSLILLASRTMSLRNSLRLNRWICKSAAMRV